MSKQSLPLWQIIVPDGNDVPDASLIFMRHAKGFTLLYGTGGWTRPGEHPESKPVYVYQVAATRQNVKAIMVDLAGIFPSEEEWSVSHIGHMTFQDAADIRKESTDKLTADLHKAHMEAVE